MFTALDCHCCRGGWELNYTDCRRHPPRSPEFIALTLLVRWQEGHLVIKNLPQLLCPSYPQRCNFWEDGTSTTWRDSRKGLLNKQKVYVYIAENWLCTVFKWYEVPCGLSATAELLVDLALLYVPLVLSSLSPETLPQWTGVDTSAQFLPEDVREMDANCRSGELTRVSVPGRFKKHWIRPSVDLMALPTIFHFPYCPLVGPLPTSIRPVDSTYFPSPGDAPPPLGPICFSFHHSVPRCVQLGLFAAVYLLQFSRNTVSSPTAGLCYCRRCKLFTINIDRVMQLQCIYIKSVV